MAKATRKHDDPANGCGSGFAEYFRAERAKTPGCDVACNGYAIAANCCGCSSRAFTAFMNDKNGAVT